MRNKKFESRERQRRKRLSQSKRSANPQVWIDCVEETHSGSWICLHCGHLVGLFDGCCVRCY